MNVSDILLNETWIGQQLQTVPLVKGTTPRWTLLGRVFNRKKEMEEVDISAHFVLLCQCR